MCGRIFFSEPTGKEAAPGLFKTWMEQNLDWSCGKQLC